MSSLLHQGFFLCTALERCKVWHRLPCSLLVLCVWEVEEERHHGSHNCLLTLVCGYSRSQVHISSVASRVNELTSVMGAGAEYRATKDMWLSPRSRLLADSSEGADFVYDGQGHRLILPEGLHEGEALPLIIIGGGKSLQLKHVKLVHAASLPACIQLGSGAPSFIKLSAWSSESL